MLLLFKVGLIVENIRVTNFCRKLKLPAIKVIESFFKMAGFEITVVSLEKMFPGKVI